MNQALDRLMMAQVTLICIDPKLAQGLKVLAAVRGSSMKALAEMFIRTGLDAAAKIDAAIASLENRLPFKESPSPSHGETA